MKALHTINLFALIITFLLYVTLFLGMYAQIILGPIQLISALTITVLWYKKLSPQLKILMQIYWTLALIALIAAILTWFEYISSYLIIPLVFVVPMLIACYFVCTTHKISNYLDPKGI